MGIVKAPEHGSARDAAVREVLWMASAMLHARRNAAQFFALLEIVRCWPEGKNLAPVARLARTNGGGSRNGGLDVIEEFSTFAALEEKIGLASLELSAKLRPAE